ncbi:MAG: adenylate/guanylate cyclase domain-containing protein [Spirochaetales bacterium]|uniref:Adenylate/guanylate cyclase domain-containing protein n=1 Tax=Candidatus Thalassospirochaeta sargassi TaxID=3119039 RepID=A0AAJ1MID7_9SPIO|nr:adenylate/guanylate cyclase domain-containing protein [Spirochaetales bacterium]
MKIRARLIFIVLPLIVAALLITGIFASYSARSGMTRLAMSSLGFKAEEMEKYMTNQWTLLVDNGLSDKPEYVEVAKSAVLSYAFTLIRSETELVFAVDSEGRLMMQTAELEIFEDEKSAFFNMLDEEKLGWVSLEINGEDRVGHLFYFAAFDWYVFLTEDSASFYREVTEMLRQNFIILGISIIASFILLLILASYITSPLTRVSNAMQGIIKDNDLSRQVVVEYRDEIGHLANTFNIMIAELDRAYQQIKEFAFKAVLAERNERKIRNIFQKYVPKDVIDSVFQNPEEMLVGQNRVLSILFSDIRSFTTISEGYSPDQLVVDLNKYFEQMVDIIIHRGGVIDKYIGDAIMAFFGAPVKHADDAYQSVMAALEMQEALRMLNKERTDEGKPEFKTGIGLNYGVVTVGNIGSEKKMDYTVIGDMVNLGSRLEGLTKQYKQEVIISESVYRKVRAKIPCRMVDKVQVKGKTQGESIYTTSITLDDRQKRGWSYHNAGAKLFYSRDFVKAARYFDAAAKLLPDDFLTGIFIERSLRYSSAPPPEDWNGVEVMTSK